MAQQSNTSKRCYLMYRTRPDRRFTTTLCNCLRTLEALVLRVTANAKLLRPMYRRRTARTDAAVEHSLRPHTVKTSQTTASLTYALLNSNPTPCESAFLYEDRLRNISPKHYVLYFIFNIILILFLKRIRNILG